MKPRILLLLMLIFIIISLILLIMSLFLPWYYWRIDLDGMKDGSFQRNIDGLYDMEDRLGKREIYIEVEYLGEIDKDTIDQDNDELKHEYPDTVNCKNITRILIVIQVILLSIILILIAVFFITPITRFPLLLIFTLIIFIFSLLIFGYFTLFYAPFEGDMDAEEDTNNEEIFEYNTETQESGNWFYYEIEFSGDLEGKGKGGVSSGYIMMIIAGIFTIISLIFAGVHYSKSKKLFRQWPQPLDISKGNIYPLQPPPKQRSQEARRKKIKVINKSENISKSPKFCSNCGAPTDGKKFCAECGEKLI